MPMRLELSRRAQADLHDIREYSVQRFGPTRTVSYLDEIEQTFRRVLAHPNIGVAHDWAGGVRSLPAGEHRVYYDVLDDRVLVQRILHKAMDVERHL